MAEKQLKVMVVAAHPQDPFERAGGTVAKHLARGDRAKLVALTTGVVTHAFGVFPLVGGDKLMDVEKVRAAKRAEFERGAKALGVAEWEILDFNRKPLDRWLAGIHQAGECDSRFPAGYRPYFASSGSGAAGPHGLWANDIGGG